MGKGLLLGLVVFGAFALVPASGDVAQAGHEVMIDRCSGEVAFSPTFHGKPTDPHTVILKRTGEGYSPWTNFTRQTSDDGHVRWWCHSTIGNVFDPGTWRVHVDRDKVKACLISIAAPVATIDGQPPCLKVIEISSSAFEGWTPEQSRCGDHSTHFRARLGANRELQTECLGK